VSNRAAASGTEPHSVPDSGGKQSAEMLLAQHQQLVSRRKDLLDAAEKPPTLPSSTSSSPRPSAR